MAKSDIQGFRDSHARLIAAEKKPARPDFYWWKGVEWLDVFHCLAKHGFDRCRVEMWEGMKASAEEREAWIVVKSEAGEILGAFNISFQCPPWCPEARTP